MSAYMKLAVAGVLCLCAIPCSPAPIKVALSRKPSKSDNQSPSSKIRFVLSTLTRQKLHSLQVGMTTLEVDEIGWFIPEASKRKGWSTVQYRGPLSPAEVKELKGKVIKVDVQIVMHPGPMGIFNPPGGSLNPTTAEETIATVSVPYLETAGPIRLD